MAEIFYYFRVYANPDMSDEGNVWIDGPTEEGIVVYSIITPIICLFGIVGNGLSLAVLMRRELRGSVYVYLAVGWFKVLAFSDLCTSLLTFFSGLSQGVLFSDVWPILDAILGIPIAGMLNSLTVLATVAVMADRSLYLRNPLACRKPKFCRSRVARRVMVICTLIAIISNIPYCFIFKWENGKLKTTAFFYSAFYSAHTWMRLIIFGIIPTILLVMGNGYLILQVQKLKRIKAKCNPSVRCKKGRDFTNLTTTLILIIFFFLITEIPSLLVSRTSAVEFFFGDGRSSKCNTKTLERMREIVTVLNAVGIAADFLLYYLFSPAFYKVLVKMLKGKSRKPIQMNVFVLDNPGCLREKMKSIKQMTMDLMDANNDDSSSAIEDPSYERYQTSLANRKTLITLCHKPSIL